MIDYRVGDTRDLTAELPDGSVHLVATSPPFLALRSYLPADHPLKHAEIGSEPDPATFLDTLLALTAEWGRVLAPWGSIAIELGDTYAGSSAQGSDQDGSTRYPTGRGADGLAHNKNTGEWPRPKCLALIPQAYAMSLAYGRNIITGAESPAGQWLVRNMIVWHRPNPAVGALGDKFRPSTSYITVATRSPKRWFDLTAVRTDALDTRPRNTNGVKNVGRAAETPDYAERIGSNPAGAPPLDAWFDEHDTWTVTTQPSKLAHYAMWPPKLAERLILSMCPEWVCRECGEPRRRIEGVASYVQKGQPARMLDMRQGDRSHLPPDVRNWGKTSGGDTGSVIRTAPTLGWTDCGHDNYAPGVVLDPFAGTGTTLCVADLHHRLGMGFDIDSRNAELVDARRAEVARSLFGTTPEIPGQLDMFGAA